MISYAVYKIVHLLGVMMIFLSLGGVLMQVSSADRREHTWRKFAVICYGIGVFLALLGGFGLLARLGIVHGTLPGWVLAKLGIWFVFAILVGVVVRKKSWAKPIWVGALVLGAVAAYLAGSKPF